MRTLTSVSAVVTTIVSLVHASYIITTGGIPVIISALVEDCMSLTVANLPVVATASIRSLTGTNVRDANPDGDGQRWSSFKFRTGTHVPGATTNWSTGIGISRPAAAINMTESEFTGTTLEASKGAIPVGAEELFAATATKVELDAEKGETCREDRGVVRIDVLPYPREQPPPES